MKETWSTRVICQGRRHRVVLTDKGRIILPNHDRADIEREMVIAALEGEPCQCVKALFWWRRHVPVAGEPFWRYRRRRNGKAGPKLRHPPGLRKLAHKAFQIRRERRRKRIGIVTRSAAPLSWTSEPFPSELRWKEVSYQARHLASCARWRWRGGLGTVGKDSLAGGRRRVPRRNRGTNLVHYKFVGMMRMFPASWKGTRLYGNLFPRGLLIDAVAYLNMRKRLRVGNVCDGKWYAMLLALYQQDDEKRWEALAVRRIPPARGRRLSFAVQHCVIRRVRGFRWEVEEWLGRPLFVAKYSPRKQRKRQPPVVAGKVVVWKSPAAAKSVAKRRRRKARPKGR